MELYIKRIELDFENDIEKIDIEKEKQELKENNDGFNFNYQGINVSNKCAFISFEAIKIKHVKSYGRRTGRDFSV